MAKSNIDENRPTIIRFVPDLGMEIYMYKDDPGVFLNAYGTPVHPDLARKAGYDVDKYLKVKQRRDLMSQAASEIERRLALEASQPGSRNVIKERDGFRLVQIGNGRCVVEDPDGTVLTGNAVINLEAASSLFEVLVPQKVVPDEVPLQEAVPAGELPGGGDVGRPSGSRKK